MELYESRCDYWFPAGAKPSPYLPWKETPEEQVQEASLFEFFHFVQFHGGRQPYLTWWDDTGEDLSRLPIVCLHPGIKQTREIKLDLPNSVTLATFQQVLI